MKLNKLLLIALIPIFVIGCHKNEIDSHDNSKEVITSYFSTSSNNEIEEEKMKLLIDDQEVNITWENNDSVKALNDIKPLNIEMHRYGGFEQVGPIGQNIVSDDINITTIPGDVVLYSSNQIVIFFGSNSWDYTKLGHINMSNEELNALLNKENVIISIK